MNVEAIKIKGQKGEDLAASYLTSLGYKIIARNYHAPFGELDLICLKHNLLVFIEVKTRCKSFESAFSSVSLSKQKKLAKTAMHFISRHKLYEDYFTRFDVVAILQTDTEEFRLKHMQDAFLPTCTY